jgi:hypothetical protein
VVAYVEGSETRTKTKCFVTSTSAAETILLMTCEWILRWSVCLLVYLSVCLFRIWRSRSLAVEPSYYVCVENKSMATTHARSMQSKCYMSFTTGSFRFALFIYLQSNHC